MGYHHFSIAERGQLDALYRLNWTTRQIASTWDVITRPLPVNFAVDVMLTATMHRTPTMAQSSVDMLPVQEANTHHASRMKLPNAYGKHGHQHRLPPIIVCIITRQYHSKLCIGGCIALSFIQ
jgi:hypothetical protein